MVKMAVFGLQKSPKNDFTQNMNDRKIMKFPHCVFSTCSVANLLKKLQHFVVRDVNLPSQVFSRLFEKLWAKNVIPP